MVKRKRVLQRLWRRMLLQRMWDSLILSSSRNGREEGNHQARCRDTLPARREKTEMNGDCPSKCLTRQNAQRVKTLNIGTFCLDGHFVYLGIVSDIPTTRVIVRQVGMIRGNLKWRSASEGARRYQTLRLLKCLTQFGK